MSPRTEEQFEEIRETKKKLILETAFYLFATEGFYPTSISKIANKAGISKGLIYNYFSSKEELIIEIVFDGIDRLMKFFDPNRDGKLTKEELKFFIEEIFRIMKKNLHFWKLYFSILSQQAVLKLVENKLLEFFKPAFKMLEDYFEKQGVEDPVMETRFFGALIDGVAFDYIIDPENFPLEKIKKRILSLYL